MSSPAQQTYAVQLSNNWTAYWNQQQNKYYYHNSKTNENTWLRPPTAFEKIVQSEDVVYQAQTNVTQPINPDIVSTTDTTDTSSITDTTDTTDISDTNLHNNNHTFTSPDGNIFVWSNETNSWELKDDSSKINGQRSNNQKKASNKRKRNSKKKNTTVYFSGIPKDATISEVENVFKRYGVIKSTAHGKLIKLYRDDEGLLKGDGTVTYLMRPAADNVISILNGGQFRPGCTITVQEAMYGGGGGGGGSGGDGGNSENQSSKSSSSSSSSSSNNVYISSKQKRPKKAQNERQKKVQRLKEQQVLSWEEGEGNHKKLTIVVLKYVFNPSDLVGAKGEIFERNLEYTIANRCEKCGTLEKLTLYSSHPDGVMIAKFKTSYGAERCIAAMNQTYGMNLNKKMLVDYWDNVESFERKRDYKEEESRVDAFGDWLEEGDPDAHLTDLDKQQQHVQPEKTEK